MRSRLKEVFSFGEPVAGAPLIFLSVILIALFQLPAQALVRAGHVSAGVAANEILAIGGVPLIIIWLARLDRRRLIPLAVPSVRTLVLVAALTLGADVAIEYLTFASELLIPASAKIDQAYEKLMAVSGAGDVVVKLFALCVFPAVFEEIYFRGFCLTSIAARFSKPAAVALSALLFAMLHGNAWYVHLYFLLGLLLGFVYLSTGSLWAAMLCHFINNAWTFSSHVAGFKLVGPSGPGASDAAILAAGLALFTASALLLARGASSTSSS